MAERKGRRAQIVMKMATRVRYGSSEVAPKYTACAICLEEFENGEDCQIFVGFIGATQTHRDNGHGMATRAATRVATVNPEELNHQIHRAMEKLTMPLVDYGCKENDGEVAGSELNECAICLEAFGNRVSCRVFPNCKHMFHTHCIIKWLGINLTCPICRTHL
ncbi:RING-H2 finger protein ATL52-like [Cucurbita pepo subsp. pepo]|uniref:RING-H2 finger protein ATL52-like n=1 Tax=Cucurbita pepo subsp. pepo TaxID=3664 RepID=UPI000C9D3F77|nr:RING-H2 finger protein ATL52-like [Cucurbita pepo subsp. pepo]